MAFGAETHRADSVNGPPSDAQWISGSTVQAAGLWPGCCWDREALVHLISFTAAAIDPLSPGVFAPWSCLDRLIQTTPTLRGPDLFDPFRVVTVKVLNKLEHAWCSINVGWIFTSERVDVSFISVQ